MSSELQTYESALRRVQRCETKKTGAARDEEVYGMAYQSLVMAGEALQIRDKYRYRQYKQVQ